MKKLSIILLTMVLLLSAFAGMAIVGSAANTEATNIVVTIDANGVATLASGELKDDALVTAVKNALAGKSAGNRYISLDVKSAFTSVAVDDVFFDSGIVPIRTALDAFLKKLIAAGVTLDGIKTDMYIIDNKNVSPTSWYLRYRHLINAEGYPNNQYIYDDIVANPLYGLYIRPMLVDRNFVFETNVYKGYPEIYGIRPYVSASLAEKLKNCPTIWDSVMYYNLSRYLIEAVETPLLENYPDAKVSGLYTIKSNEYAHPNKSSASPGETIKLTAKAAPAGKQFYKWSVSLGSASVEFSNIYDQNATFVMPAGNVVVVPVFKDIGAAAPKTYEVTISGDGICDFGAGSYAPGAKVTVNCGVPAKGMMFGKWTITGDVVLDKDCTENDGTITFVMPEGNVHFEASFVVDDRPPVPTPTVTINDGGDGFSGQGQYAAGSTVTIHAGARDGYVFTGWQVEGDAKLVSPSSRETTFIIGNGDVVLTATWKKIEEPAEGITPFYLVNWSSAEGMTNVFDLPFFWSPRTVPAEGAMMQVQWNNSYDIKEIARMLKEHFDKRPEGTRFFNLTAWQGMAQEAARAENIVFMDKGGTFIARWIEAFLTEYKAIGGKLDGIVTDMEYFDPWSWYLNSLHYKDGMGNADIYNQIVNDPRYATEIRPLLEERGFKFFEGIDGIAEIYGIYPRMEGDDYARCRSIWDAVMRTRLNQYITKYVYEPLIAFYPDADVCDYQGRSMDAWNKETEYDGSPMFVGGNREMAGNNTNINFYLHRPSNAYYENLSTKPYGFNSAYYAETPFSAALWEFNVFKNLYKAADGYNISTWIAYYDYHSGEMGDETDARVMSGTAYYSEVLFHIGLLDPKPFIGFIVPGATTDGMYAGSGEDYIRRVRVASECLEELTRIVGASDREPILVPTTWSDGYLLSGMYAGGKNYWRITPDTTHTSLSEFRVKGVADPTFSIGGKTVTFPGGKIIEDGYVSEIGTCGYWVETATDVYPVFSYDENRYENNPSYLENYDHYLIGTEYTYDIANPTKAWEISKKKDATAVIKRDPTDFSNNMLALSGGITLKNVTIPSNITAGDNYAKQQVWELSFYLPEDLAADAEITMLNTAKKDGLKFVDGKLYYYGGEDFVELTALPLGAKYTVKRVLDFRTKDAFTTDYIIYDATGKEIAKVSNVPVNNVYIPVSSISIGVANVVGNSVLFDDYKLYPIGVAADLEIYNAKTGIMFDDQTIAHAEESAYRLSWMNASDATQNATIMSAYYDAAGNLVSEEVIKTIQMVPGADGVETGIAKKAADGQTQLIYLRVDETPSENNQETPDSNLDLIIGICAGAAVLVVAVVIVLVVLKKKKATPTAE